MRLFLFSHFGLLNRIYVIMGRKRRKQYKNKNTSRPLYNKAYVINLRSAEQRMLAFKNQTAQANITNVTRINAIEAKTLPKSLLDRALSSDAYRFMTWPQLGCALSHWRCYYEIATQQQTNNDPDDLDRFLVCEDDIEFDKDFNKKLRHILKVCPPDFDVLALGHIQALSKYMAWSDSSVRPIASDKRSNIIYEPSFFTGAQCYLVTRKGAKKLMKLSLPITNLADLKFSNAELKRRLNVYAVAPMIARPSKNSANDSSLVSGRPSLISLLLGAQLIRVGNSSLDWFMKNNALAVGNSTISYGTGIIYGLTGIGLGLYDAARPLTFKVFAGYAVLDTLLSAAMSRSIPQLQNIAIDIVVFGLAFIVGQVLLMCINRLKPHAKTILVQAKQYSYRLLTSITSGRRALNAPMNQLNNEPAKMAGMMEPIKHSK